MNIQGILDAFDAGTYTATVRPIGALGAQLTGVPVNRGIAAAAMVATRKVLIELLGDDGNHTNAVLTAVWT